MNLSTLNSLQTRIREATGADRELDALIAAAFLGGEAYHMPAGYEGFRWVRRDPVDNAVFGPAPYTTDPDGLGACVGLMREVLPGCDWGIGCDIGDDERKGFCQAYVGLRQWAGDASGVRVYTGKSAYGTPALSLLLAIVAALIAEEEAKERVG